MAGYPVNRYRESQVMTASPEQLLLALYDGAVKFTQQMKQSIADRKPAEKGKACNRALGIIYELSNTLDHEKSPELCANLERLYHYLIDRITHASVHMNAEPLDEVLVHLKQLRETWQEAISIAGRTAETQAAV